MKFVIIIMLLMNFYQNHAQSSHNINVKIHQDVTCKILNTGSHEAATFQVFPNPVTTDLHIKSSKTIKVILVYNIIGQEVMRHRVINDETTIDVRNIQSGIYTLHMRTDAEVYNHKIVIQHD